MFIWGQRATGLDDTDPVSNVKGVKVTGEADVSLLLAVGPHEGVDLLGGVVVHLLHGALGGQGVPEDAELVELVRAGNRPPGVLGVAGKAEGLRAEEVHIRPDLADTLGGALRDGLLELGGLGPSLGSLAGGLLGDGGVGLLVGGPLGGAVDLVLLGGGGLGDVLLGGGGLLGRGGLGGGGGLLSFLRHCCYVSSAETPM